MKTKKISRAKAMTPYQRRKESETRRKMDKLTPVQVRAKLVSVLKNEFAYTVSSQMREFGRNKAWLRPPTRKRIAGEKRALAIYCRLLDAGFRNVSWRKGYGGEYEVRGPGFEITVNQEDSGGGRTSNVFVQTVKKTAPYGWQHHDGYPGVW